MCWLVLSFALVFGPYSAAHAPSKQENAPQAQPQQQEPPNEDIPPEEDESVKPKEYSFNPLSAEKELRIGNFYFKKGSYKAAANRFTEATKWNPNFAEAYLRLGDALEKLHDRQSARQAYSKYIELEPTAKNADAIRKKIGAKKKK